MITLKLKPDITEEILQGLRKAGSYEIGGIMMGEHVGHNEFVVTHITVHRKGTIAAFIRKIEDAISRMKHFFHQSNEDYQRFNYIGEWHSHPLFPAYPSAQDDSSMLEIVSDDSVGANFAVLLIVKLDTNQNLTGSVHTYLPNGLRSQSTLVVMT